MQKPMICAAALALLSLPALAQEHNVGKAAADPATQNRAQAQLGVHPSPGGNHGAPGGNHGGPRPSGPPGHGNWTGGNNRPSHNLPGNNRPDFRPDNRPDNRPGNRPDNHPGNRPGYRPGGDNFRPGPGFGGPRHDFSGFRGYHQAFRAQRRFRGPDYRRPAGWYARRWTFGEILPALFWTQDYWLTDYAEYDLPPPPYGAVWVRDGNDALLIDRDSGEIISVEYDVFY